MDFYVPIQSYYKAQIIELFNNEGEPKWDFRRLSKKMDSRPELIEELNEKGYDVNDKYFTGEQVRILFKHLGRPILSEKNRKYLNLKLDNTIRNLITITMKNLDSNKLLTDKKYLAQLGLQYQEGGDVNPHFNFSENTDYYFMPSGNELLLRKYGSMDNIAQIKNTESLLSELSKIANN